MPKFRKKPVEIEAMQWDGTADGATQIIEWIHSYGSTATYTCSDPDRCAETNGDTPHAISIRTLEGTMRADLGDWIIREPFPTDDRKFYPCKPDIFAATYERVDGSTTATGTTELETTARVLSALHRSAEDTVTRVIALHEQWVKAGPPPLGAPLARWWDQRLAELHNAIQPAGESTPAATPGSLRAALNSVYRAMVHDPRDWAATKRDAWLYAILVGWTCEDDHAHDDLCMGDEPLIETAQRHGWDEETVTRLRAYRAAIAALGIDGAGQPVTAAEMPIVLPADQTTER
jgi:hypothetical protein